MRWYTCAFAAVLVPIYGCNLLLGICIVAIPKPPLRSATRPFDAEQWRRAKPSGYQRFLLTHGRKEMAGNAVSAMRAGSDRESVEEQFGDSDYEFEPAGQDGTAPLFPDTPTALQLVERRKNGARTVETWLAAQYDQQDRLQRSFLLRWVRTPHGEAAR
ncbi:MAG: hypothetical protein JNJ88_14345 [Planctomycetes bacterium]|nr:hypothetical protein [Planctomycetota bacterium]